MLFRNFFTIQSNFLTVTMIKHSRCPVMLLTSLFTALLTSLLTSVSANVHEILGNFSVNVTFSPPYVTNLAEGRSQQVNLLLTFESRDQGNYGGLEMLENLNNLSLKYEPDDPAVAWVTTTTRENGTAFSDSSSRLLTWDSSSSSSTVNHPKSKNDKVYYFNTTFTVGGKFLGKTKIVAKPSGGENDEGKKIDTGSSSLLDRLKFNVWVVRDNHRMQHIFIGTLTILLILANVLMGAQLNLKIVLEVLKKPLAPAIGFACQYVFMPLISYGLAQLLFSSVGMYNLGLGMFTTGCCPGGGASNGYTVLLDGNVDLSITMTFISTMAALVMMPFWMFALGRHFLVDISDQPIYVPYKNICYSLLVLILPLAVGVCIRRFLTKWADKARIILRPFLISIIVFICTFGVYINLYMFKLMTWRVLIGGMALPWIGFTFGLLASVLFRLKLPDMKAIAIETGIQNTGIGIMLLQLSFLQPDADLASVVPVVVAIFTPGPLLIALTVHCILKCRANREKAKEKEMEDMSPSRDLDLPDSKEDKNGNLHNFDCSQFNPSDSATPLFGLKDPHGKAAVLA